MAHSLILGMSESGKTTLAKQLAAKYKQRGMSNLVLDPLRDPEWPCDFITADQREFLALFWRSESCMAFMDEGAESIGRYDMAMRKTATQGRHWGHSCHFITHRASDIAPVVRYQCRHLFLFCSARADGEILAREYNEPLLEECSSLKQFEFFHASRFGGVYKCRVDLNGGNVNVDSSGNRRNSSDNGRLAMARREGESNNREEGDSEEKSG